MRCRAARSRGSRYVNTGKRPFHIKSLMSMHSDYIMRVSHPEPGMKAKEYYKALVDSFNNDVNDFVDQIGNLHS